MADGTKRGSAKFIIVQAPEFIVMRGEFSYPLAIGRDRYLTRVGGYSESLKGDRIGVHYEALWFNTKLSAGDRVLVSAVGEDPSLTSRPLFARPVFRVEPITDFHDSRLLAMSSEGEAILPKSCLYKLKEGEEIVLNAAVNRLPRDWIYRLVRRHLRGREQGHPGEFSSRRPDLRKSAFYPGGRRGRRWAGDDFLPQVYLTN